MTGAAMGAFLASACDAVGAPAGQAKRKEPVTLDFQHRWDGPAREPLVERQIRRFEQMNENVTVNITMNMDRGEGTSGGIPTAKILTAIAAGTPPEVFMIYNDAAADFAERQVLTVVDPLLKRDKVNPQDVWFPSVWPLIQSQGKTFALSQDAAGDNPYLFYNKNMLAASGVNPSQLGTWDGLLAAAKTLTKVSGDSFSEIGFPYPGGTFSYWQTSNGGELLSKDGRKVAFNTATGRDTLTHMTDSVKQVYGTPQKLAAFIQQFAGSARPGRAVDQAAWFSGKLAVMASGPWEWLETPQYAPQVQMAAARMPVNRSNPQSKQTTLAEGVWTWAMGARSKHPDDAWLLEKWLSFEDGHKELMISMGRATMVKRVVQDKAFADKNPGWPLVLETINAATALPPSKGWAMVSPILNKLADDVLSGKFGVADALTQATREAQTALDEAYRVR